MFKNKQLENLIESMFVVLEERMKIIGTQRELYGFIAGLHKCFPDDTEAIQKSLDTVGRLKVVRTKNPVRINNKAFATDAGNPYLEDGKCKDCPNEQIEELMGEVIDEDDGFSDDDFKLPEDLVVVETAQRSEEIDDKKEFKEVVDLSDFTKDVDGSINDVVPKSPEKIENIEQLRVYLRVGDRPANEIISDIKDYLKAKDVDIDHSQRSLLHYLDQMMQTIAKNA